MLPMLPTTAVAPGAWRYAAACFVAAVIAVIVFPPLAGVALALGIAVLWFHRDPGRNPPESGIVAPADGRVSVLREEGDELRVGIFMNVTDVHVNRAPASGTVQSVDHRPGAYKPAFSKDSDRNERVVIDCGDYQIALIAGWFARRIHPYVAGGDDLVRGQRIGHVSFGSRADVVLPPRYDREDVLVAVDETVTAGKTRLVATEAAESTRR
ncbi:phosphatidylserine decarboxylase [Halonotius aquaticus]|uniref:Phosphatidylserine decarboxylase n=1 Tax=Halonotius aquaticus TaxID=2216978 RepID=A0A3A6PV42_9EURY|nr:protein sorting system archaetidylserine decarboxylase [Halonotius aquaticus]RJX43280.1 phosphatidylserine decarboxylase [Halonotius aquaticus]